MLNHAAHESNDIQGVVFVSGDLHMANLMHVPGRDVGGRAGPAFWVRPHTALRRALQRPAGAKPGRSARAPAGCGVWRRPSMHGLSH
ncbi:uncharacterized protein SOCE26_038540 [Sorangium cellulosum]|uniref:PhoD-like phosphatase metallophosphatase domain-containing protein n=1 Tax=Sorangium cellulosum TaxID=56 RepID=A0A2L0ET27_SORCE|nr:uncharacterized protein SOCE26_038540 [Sorangium cellulosum]